jgi:uncharacterized membrane protein SpoIIM required for sporulation
VIIDLPRFLEAERRYWTELEALLIRWEDEPGHRPALAETRRFHYLYERTAADLARLATFASEPELRRFLESLVARAYAEIHETRAKPHRLAPVRWFTQTFPQTFRRQIQAFWLSVAVMTTGCLLGGLAVSVDPEAKAVILPFPQLQGNPAERVAAEESQTADPLSGVKATFSTALMTHNTKVALLTLALGMTWGVGTLILLFYNGVILGAVAVDYLLAGQGRFLMAWLLPHGSVEIPAILIAGQAGLVLAGALLGRGQRGSLGARLRAVAGDLLTLVGGISLLLVWAGAIEAFLSQYHEPMLPYAAKILLGLAEAVLLTLFLAMAGRDPTKARPAT